MKALEGEAVTQAPRLCGGGNRFGQTDALAAAANNSQLEGDDVAFTTASSTTRLGNYCQISRKQVIVSGTAREVLLAGREDEYARLLVKAGRELKRDMEVALSQNAAATAGSATVARTLAGLESWIATTTHTMGGTGGTTPGASGGSVFTAPTDGTLVSALSEAVFQDCIGNIWSVGGNPSMVLVGKGNKRQISTFSGIAPLRTTAVPNQAVTIVAGADMYESNFGTLTITPSRFNRDRTVSVLDTDFWAVAFLRGIQEHELAKTGDADKSMVLAEFTLEARNEASSGKIADVSV